MLEKLPEVNELFVRRPPFVSLEWSCLAFVKLAIVGVVNVLLVKVWVAVERATGSSILIVKLVVLSVSGRWLSLVCVRHSNVVDLPYLFVTNMCLALLVT